MHFDVASYICNGAEFSCIADVADKHIGGKNISVLVFVVNFDNIGHNSLPFCVAVGFLFIYFII